MSAGSDAHGSFNYANTDMTLAVTENINDNSNRETDHSGLLPTGHGGTMAIIFCKP